MNAAGYFTAEEFQKKLLELYSEGVSRHGLIYLHRWHYSEGKAGSHIKNEFMIETTFELIRRLKFPERASRFVSSFGCLNLEDARTLKNKFGEGTIYKVSCEKYYQADMNLLVQVASTLGYEMLAEKYWSGEPSSNPFWEVLMSHPVQIMEQVE